MLKWGREKTRANRRLRKKKNGKKVGVSKLKPFARKQVDKHKDRGNKIAVRAE